MSREFPSKSALRAQKRREREAEEEELQGRFRREEQRKAALTMWERIEEADASSDVKDILRRLLEMIESP